MGATIGQVAAQLRGEAGDQHRVLVIGLVEGQVLGPPRPRAHQRLHTHERHTAVSRQLADHPPPVPGRLGRDGHAGEAGRGRALAGPLQRRTQLPGAPPERPPRQHPRLMISHHHHLLGISQIDPGDRVTQRHRPRSRASLALRLRSPRETPLRSDTDVLLCAWDPNPNSASGGRRLRLIPTRKTTYYAAVRRDGKAAVGDFGCARSPRIRRHWSPAQPWRFTMHPATHWFHTSRPRHRDGGV